MQNNTLLRAVHSGGKWEITVKPSVSGMFKRIFDGVEKVGQQLVLSDTPMNARNLLWFAERYKSEFQPHLRVLAQASLQDDREEAVLRILSEDYKPSNPQLALPPRDYQMRAVDLAVANGALLLGDQVGVGKTLAGIALIARADGLPAVVVTLTALPLQWSREFKKFAPELRVHIIKSGKPYPLDRNGKGQKIPLPDVVIMSYSKLTTRAVGCRSWAEVLSEAGYNKSICFDEVQELRNPDTDRYRAAKLLREGACRCIGLSATPVLNHGAEIHAVVNIVQPGALGDQKEFLREWCDKEVNGDGELSGETMRKTRVTDPVALGAHLRDIGVFLRRTREDIGRELPPLQRIFHELEIDEGEVEMDGAEIERLCQMVIRGGAGSFRASGDLDWRLRQATGQAKAMHVVGFVRLLIESGERVVLYGHHHSVYDLWRKAFSDTSLGDLKPSFYTGEESAKQKDEQLQRFLRKETPLMIIALRAGAGLDGIQYSGCGTVVFGEFDWSPGVVDQCVGRVFRDGQPNPVMAYFLWANWGADPVMMDALNLKTEQSEGILTMQGGAALLKGADPGQIRKLAEAHLRRIGKL